MKKLNFVIWGKSFYNSQENKLRYWIIHNLVKWSLLKCSFSNFKIEYLEYIHNYVLFSTVKLNNSNLKVLDVYSEPWEECGYAARVIQQAAPTSAFFFFFFNCKRSGKPNGVRDKTSSDYSSDYLSLTSNTVIFLGMQQSVTDQISIKSL